MATMKWINKVYTKAVLSGEDIFPNFALRAKKRHEERAEGQPVSLRQHFSGSGRGCEIADTGFKKLKL